MTTEIQKLRQRAAEALARAQAAKPAIGMSREGQLMMGGVQAGSVAMLETVLDWIDEIAEEGKDSEDHHTPD